MKGRDLLRILTREPLNYRVVRQKGSHRRMEAEGRMPLTLSIHDSATASPALVKKVLLKDAGLTEEQAWEVLS